MTDTSPVDDDKTIPDDAEVWRRIPPLHWKKVEGSASGYRQSSANFDEEELSVVLAAECGGLDTLLAGHEGFGVACLTVRELRDLGWGVVRFPVDGVPGHLHVLGKKTTGKCRKAAKACQIIVEPRVGGDETL